MASRYTRDTWEWIKNHNNPTPSFLQWAREEGFEPLESAGSELPKSLPEGSGEDQGRRTSVVSIQSRPNLSTGLAQSTPSTEDPGEHLTGRQSRRRPELLPKPDFLEHRIQPRVVSPASTTNVHAAYYRPGYCNSSPPSGSLDRRLKEAGTNRQRNRGRHRSEALLPSQRTPQLSASTFCAIDRVPSLGSYLQEAKTDRRENSGRDRSETIRPPKRSSGSASAAGVRNRSAELSITCGTEFTPSVKAVLDYQRTLGYGKPTEKEIRETDPRTGDRRPNETVFKYCNICGDDLSKPTWCVHPEYEGQAVDLLNDAVLNRGHIKYEGRSYVIKQPELRGNLEKLFAMIHPKNLCTLLTENVQEEVTNWAVYTTNGTLLGYSEGTTIEQARTVAALTGAAWRINNNLCLKGLDDIPDPGPFLNNIEVFPYGPKGSWANLRCMFAEVNGLVIAVHDVKERLLVAGMLPLDAIEEAEDDQAAERMKSLRVFEETEEGEEGARSASSSISGSHTSTSTGSSEVQAKGKGKDQGKETGSHHDGKRLSRKDIMMLKVEGMVEVLQEDLVKFKIPDEFY